MKYLVAIPLPEPWRGQLAEVKHRFRPLGWRDTMDPHITLLAPDRPLLPIDDAVAAFMAAPISSPSFNVHASSIGVFERRHTDTIVLLPRSPSYIVGLYKSLLPVALWQETQASTKRPFEPHITLVNQLPSEQANSARSALMALNLAVNFLCDTVALYAKQAHWPRWTELSRRPLGEKQHLDRHDQSERAK